MDYDYIFRGVMVGDPNVGKTSLCQKYCYDKCPEDHDPTIGVDFFSKTLDWDHPPHHYHIKLQLWDTGGSDTFKSITRSYYRNTALVFIVYDCTQRKSFKDAREWLKDVQTLCEPSAIVTLVHNKADLGAHSQVTVHESQAWAEEQGLLWVETSAPTGSGVNLCFDRAVQEMCRKLRLGLIPPDPRLGIRAADRDPILELAIDYSPTSKKSDRWCYPCAIV